MAHVVNVPLVIAKDGEGKDVYLYAGAIVPSNIKADEIKRLTPEGYITEVGGEDDSPGGFPEGAPESKWTVAQLTAYATANDVDVSAAKNKTEVLAALGVVGD